MQTQFTPSSTIFASATVGDTGESNVRMPHRMVKMSATPTGPPQPPQLESTNLEDLLADWGSRDSVKGSAPLKLFFYAHTFPLHRVNPTTGSGPVVGFGGKTSTRTNLKLKITNRLRTRKEPRSKACFVIVKTTCPQVACLLTNECQLGL